MPAGIETFVQGTSIVQITDKYEYFNFVTKGSFTVPNQTPPAGYNYVAYQLSIPSSVLTSEFPMLAIRNSRSAVFYLVHANGAEVRYAFLLQPGQTVEWWLFANRSPSASSYGFQLYKEGKLVFDALTPTANPIASVDSEIPFPGDGRVYAAVMSNYFTEREYQFTSWEDQDTGRKWNRYETYLTAMEGVYIDASGLRVQGISRFLEVDSGFVYDSWQGEGGTFYDNGQTQILVLDVTGI